ncbi:MAG: domain nucleic acid-binding-like protein [Polaromonas sp.]|nr:domain nucleic acid-binding-like protein [Polaromonas sp.]
MAVLVDTNVIADVLYNDPEWGDWSAQQLARHFGGLFINPVIYAELSYRASTQEEVSELMERLGLGYMELPLAALFSAGQAYRTYRQRGGLKTAPLPDFFIGAHAQAAGLMLLTRDKSRYATYFPGAHLICP